MPTLSVAPPSVCCRHELPLHMPKWLDSVSADVAVRRIDRAGHSYYFDANDGLPDLTRCLPKLRLVGADTDGSALPAVTVISIDWCAR